MTFTHTADVGHDTTRSADDAELIDYIRILRHGWFIIAAAATAGILLALVGASLRSPTYEASSTVVIRPLVLDPVTQFTARSSGVDAATERQIATSRNTAETVRSNLELETSANTLLENLRVETTADADILRFVFESYRADRAAEISNGFAAAYLDYRNAQAQQVLDEIALGLEDRLVRLQDDLSEVEDELTALDDDDPTDSDLTVDATLLSSQTAQVEAELATVLSRAVTGGELISPAVMPNEPSGTGTLALAIIGGGLAAMFGAVVVFLRYRFDARVTDGDVAQALFGLPVLGRVDRRRVARLPWRPTINDTTRVAMRRAAAATDATMPTSTSVVTLFDVGAGVDIGRFGQLFADGLARHARVVHLDLSECRAQEGTPTTTFQRVEEARDSVQILDFIDVGDGGAADRLAMDADQDHHLRPAEAVVALVPHYDLVVVGSDPLDNDPLALDLVDIPDTIVIPVVSLGRTRRDEAIQSRRDLTMVAATVPGIIIEGPRRLWGRTVVAASPEGRPPVREHNRPETTATQTTPLPHHDEDPPAPVSDPASIP